MASVRELNDAFRTSGEGGRIVVTRGVHEKGAGFVAQALERVRTFDAFTKDNDPYGEHDFGSFELDGEKLYWKIDCYDKEMRYGSEDPSDPEKPRASLPSCLPRNTEALRPCLVAAGRFLHVPSRAGAGTSYRRPLYFRLSILLQTRADLLL